MFDALIRQMAEERGLAPKEILPEAAIERLREALPRFQDENPYKPGDVVTIREDAPLRGAGKPHLVVKVAGNLSKAAPDTGEWADGVDYNVQIISISGDHIVPHVCPHWALDYYTPEDDGGKKPAATLN